MQRYFSKNKKNNKFELNSDDIYHITRVMRMKSNDKIEVVYNNEVYICNLDFNNNEVDISIIEKLENNKNDKIEKVLIIPLLKENREMD